MSMSVAVAVAVSKCVSIPILILVLCPLVVHSGLLVCLRLLMRLVLVHRKRIGRKEGRRRGRGRGRTRHRRREAHVPGRMWVSKRRHMRGNVLIATIIQVVVLALEMGLVAPASWPERNCLGVHRIGRGEIGEGHLG